MKFTQLSQLLGEAGKATFVVEKKKNNLIVTVLAERDGVNMPSFNVTATPEELDAEILPELEKRMPSMANSLHNIGSFSMQLQKLEEEKAKEVGKAAKKKDEPKKEEKKEDKAPELVEAKEPEAKQEPAKEEKKDDNLFIDL